jgi:hypothetical protein
MDKDFATFRLGGHPEQAARWIGISSEVYKEWPDRLHPLMVDRVYAAILRRAVAQALGMTPRQFFADVRGETVIEAMLAKVSMTAITASMLKRVPPEYSAVDPEEGRRRRRAKPQGSTGTPTASAVG